MTPNTDRVTDHQEGPDEYDLLFEKVPSRYRDLYDSDDFEKFHRGKDWSE